MENLLALILMYGLYPVLLILVFICLIHREARENRDKEDKEVKKFTLTSTYSITNMCPGIVLVRNLLTEQQQLELLDIVLLKGGLMDTNGRPNFLGQKGRHFCAIDQYNSLARLKIQFLMTQVKELVEKSDPTLVFPPVTHVITYLYATDKGMPWHKDDYGENNGDYGAPVFCVSLGNDCTFEFKNSQEKVVSLLIKSGDLFVFGGPQRMVEHQVARVHPGTFLKTPGFDARISLTGTFAKQPVFNSRISLTFRTCTGLTNVAQYDTSNYRKKWLEENKKKK